MSASIAGTGYGNEIFDEGSAGQMESRVGGRDTPGLTFFTVYFAWSRVVSVVLMVVFGCLRHAGGWLVFQGFLGCLVWSGLRWWLGWCKLFPCCRSARVAPLGWFGLAERGWFENSRACLYYFVESF